MLRSLATSATTTSLDDFLAAAIDDNLEQSRRFLARFEAIDTTGFPDQEVLNKELMVRDLRMDLEGARFKPWEMPVNQFSGIHIDAPQLVSILSFESVKDYEDYITRLKLLPRLFDQTIVQMRKGMADGLMPPKILLEQVVTQANGIATTRGREKSRSRIRLTSFRTRSRSRSQAPARSRAGRHP